MRADMELRWSEVHVRPYEGLWECWGGVPLGQEQVRAHLVIHLISNEHLPVRARIGRNIPVGERRRTTEIKQVRHGHCEEKLTGGRGMAEMERSVQKALLRRGRLTRDNIEGKRR